MITRMVLEKLWENDLFLKAKKCEFYKTKIEYPGMIIEEGKISMDPVKLRGIRDWPTPTMVKPVWSFLGFGNFCRKFISHYSNLAWPLNNLTKKDKKFEWTQMSKSVWYLETTIYRRTSTIDAWPIKTVPNWIRCVKSGNRSGTHSIGFERWPMLISLPGNDQEYVMQDCQPQYTDSIQN